MIRKSGILLPIFSLHGDYSIGSFGKEAFEFVDFLSDSGFSYWQLLPLCITDEYHSPYCSAASFGANPYFIDLCTLEKLGYITEDELLKAKQLSPYLCEYERLEKERMPLLEKAASRAYLNENTKKNVFDFIEKNQSISNAAKFLALKEKNKSSAWQSWEHTTPDGNVLFKWQFIQYEFYRQFRELKKYANLRGIELIGDLPIYVSLDSADVWSDPKNFQLNSDNQPTAVAGVPPDYFSEDGQLWGNPLYDFKKMKNEDYNFFRKRVAHALTLFDGLRIDHFRAFESYWSVPSDSKTAKDGKWVKGPGKAIINAIRDVAKEKIIIAEDLGHITHEVKKLLDYSKFPGMRVLQFAFLGDKDTPHLPHHYTQNCIVYTGTHDNNTLLGYIFECEDSVREHIFNYFGYYGSNISHACRQIVKYLLSCPADTVVFPIQDILGFGSDTRINTPGKANGNWQYRITKEQLLSIDRKHYKYLNELYGRI